MSDRPPSRSTRRHGAHGGSVSVFVADEQGGAPHPVDARRWSALAEKVVPAAGVRAESELSILFVSSTDMAELNRRFTGGDGPTDVLAFPMDGPGGDSVGRPDEGSRGPGRQDPAEDQPLMLGDVVICPAVAAANAPTHAGSYEDELALLLVHGILHLVGMDHADDVGRQRMQARERELLEAFHGPLAADPWRERHVQGQGG